MKIIAKISRMIDAEMNDAEKYIACAAEARADYPEAAKMFAPPEPSFL